MEKAKAVVSHTASMVCFLWTDIEPGKRTGTLACFKNGGLPLMHELGIAQSIYEIVQQSVPEALTPDVRKIRIRVGQLAGIIPESLDFCFNAVVTETKMKEAALCIEQVPLMAECRNCQSRFQIDDLAFFCPSCQSTRLELVSGKELEVVAIELVEKGDEIS